MLFRRCAVGGQDYSHTGDDDEHLVPSSRLKEDLLIGTFRQHLQEFLVVLAICNTVVVNSQPHYDNMNSSGVIEEPQKNGDETGRFAHQYFPTGSRSFREIGSQIVMFVFFFSFSGTRE